MATLTDIALDMDAIIGALKLANPAVFANAENNSWVPFTGDALVETEDQLVAKGIPQALASNQCAHIDGLIGLYSAASTDFEPADKDCIDGSPVLVTILVEDGEPAASQRPRVQLDKGTAVLSIGRQSIPIQQDDNKFVCGSLIAQGVLETEMQGSKGAWTKASIDFIEKEEGLAFNIELRTKKDLQPREITRGLQAGAPLTDYIVASGGGYAQNLKTLGVGYFKIASATQEENRFAPGSKQWVVTLSDDRSVIARDSVAKSLEAFGQEEAFNEVLQTSSLYVHVASINPIDEKRAKVKAFLVFEADVPEEHREGSSAAPAAPATATETEAEEAPQKKLGSRLGGLKKKQESES